MEAHSLSSLSDVGLEDGSGLRSRATGLDIESIDVINGDRRYLYATTFETAEGMSPLPVFQISPNTTPGESLYLHEVSSNSFLVTDKNMGL